VYHGINYLAVVIAAIVYMAIGAIWYSPIIFGKAWLKGIGKTKEELAGQASAMIYIWALIASFIASYGIARIMYWTQTYSVGAGIRIGLVASVCFVLTTFSINDGFEHRPMGLTFGNILYHIIGFVVAGIIIGAWH
jgi:hypothetical protein